MFCENKFLLTPYERNMFDLVFLITLNTGYVSISICWHSVLCADEMANNLTYIQYCSVSVNHKVFQITVYRVIYLVCNDLWGIGTLLPTESVPYEYFTSFESSLYRVGMRRFIKCKVLEELS
jgi:hypothetical protein